jgi:hypothetical protein
MLSSTPELRAVQATHELEATLALVETHLSALGSALKLQDAQGAEDAAFALHQALAATVERFGRANREGVSPELRRRLARTSSQVAAQRDAVTRASGALDRAIDVLLPGNAPRAAGVYGASGYAASRLGGGGFLKA